MAIGGNPQSSSFGYDNNSNLVSLTDPLSKTTAFGFDALNRLITATNPLMGVRTTGYDPQDNVTSEADERNVTTSYVYNGFGEPIQEASLLVFALPASAPARRHAGGALLHGGEADADEFAALPDDLGFLVADLRRDEPAGAGDDGVLFRQAYARAGLGQLDDMAAEHVAVALERRQQIGRLAPVTASVEFQGHSNDPCLSPTPRTTLTAND